METFQEIRRIAWKTVEEILKLTLNDVVTGTPSSSTFLRGDGSWQTPITAATQADQETATSTTTYVSPGRQQFHPSAAKAWCKGDFSGTVIAAYNVSSITDHGTGNQTVTFTTAFSSADYAFSVTAKSISDIWGQGYTSVNGQLAGSCQIATVNGGRSLADADNFYFIAFGDR